MKFKTAAGIAFVLTAISGVAASALDREIPGTGGTTFAAIGASINNGVSFVPSGTCAGASASCNGPGGSFTGIGESYSRASAVPASQDLAAVAPAVVTPAVEIDKSHGVRHAYQTANYNPALRHRMEMLADSYIAYLDRRAREPVTPQYDAALVQHERAHRAQSARTIGTRRAYQN